MTKLVKLGKPKGIQRFTGTFYEVTESNVISFGSVHKALLRDNYMMGT